jgi:hypothetical protein
MLQSLQKKIKVPSGQTNMSRLFGPSKETNISKCHYPSSPEKKRKGAKERKVEEHSTVRPY